MKLSRILLSFLVFTMLTPVALAKVVVLEDDDKYVLSENEFVDDDLWVATEEVIIDGTINGDLYAAGGIVAVNGTVTGDVYAAGGLLEIEGEVGQDVVLGGGQIVLAGATIGDGSVLFAGDVRVDRLTTIAGSLVFGSGTMDLAGTVARNVLGGTGLFRLSGVVGRDAQVAGGEVRLENTAEVNGNLSYISEEELEMRHGSVVFGEIIELQKKFEEVEFPKGLVHGFARGFQIWSFLSAMIVGLILLALFPKQTQEIAQDIREHPWITLFAGSGVLVLTPFVIILIMATILGLPVAVLLGLGYAVSIYLAKLVVGILLGRALFELLGMEKVNSYVSFIVGFLIYSLLVTLPYAGPFVWLIALIYGLGAMAHFKYQLLEKTSSQRPKKAKKKKRKSKS